MNNGTACYAVSCKCDVVRTCDCDYAERISQGDSDIFMDFIFVLVYSSLNLPKLVDCPNQRLYQNFKGYHGWQWNGCAISGIRHAHSRAGGFCQQVCIDVILKIGQALMCLEEKKTTN